MFYESPSRLMREQSERFVLKLQISGLDQIMEENE